MFILGSVPPAPPPPHAPMIQNLSVVFILTGIGFVMVALPPVRKAVRDLIDRTTDKIYGPIPPKTPKPASTETAETAPESISSAPRREIDNFDLDMFSS